MDKKPLIQRGWLRALIFLLLTIITAIVCLAIGAQLFPSNKVDINSLVTESLPHFTALYSLSAVGNFILLFIFIKVIDKRSLYSLGFEWKGHQRDALIGFFAGVVLLGLGSLVLAAFGYLKFTGFIFNASNILFSLLLFIVVAFSEELIFRGYLLNNLMQSVKPWVALTLSSFAFGLFHMSNPGAGLLPVLNVFIAGFLLGINYIFTKNLWFGIFFHFSWNYFEGTVFGYNVSGFTTSGFFSQSIDGPAWITGGDFGFEGSLIEFFLTIIAVIIFAKYFSRKYTSDSVPIFAANV